MNHIVIDLELNQSTNNRKHTSSANISECPFEIIQIGAVKLNDELEIVDEFSVLIKPQIYPFINPVVERITGISDEDVENCPVFEEVYNDFAEFVGKEDSILYTWGTDDVKSLFRNIKYFKCDENIITNKFLNIQPTAAKLLNSMSGGTIGLKTASELFDIKLELNFHDALNDAIYTAEIFKRIFSELPDPMEYVHIVPSASKKKIHTKIDTKGLIDFFEQSLERKLTGEESAIILTAYKLGRKRKYENN